MDERFSLLFFSLSPSLSSILQIPIVCSHCEAHWFFTTFVLIWKRLLVRGLLFYILARSLAL